MNTLMNSAVATMFKLRRYGYVFLIKEWVCHGFGNEIYLISFIRVYA